MTIAYYSVLNKILNSGHPSEDRTGTGTIKLFGEQMRFSLKHDNLPLLTGKHVSFKNVLTELLWFISGNTNVRALQRQGNHIWDEWCDEDGNLGPVYGHQWRMWRKYVEIEPMEERKLARCYSENIDQLANAINILKENPNSRRAVVSAWNPSDLKDMALEPCHVLFQFQAREISFHERSLMAGIVLPSRGHVRDSEYMRRCMEASHQMDVGGIPKYTLSCRVDQRSGKLSAIIKRLVMQTSLNGETLSETIPC